MPFNLQDILSVITGPLTYVPAIIFILLYFLAQEKIINALKGHLDRNQYYNLLILLTIIVFIIVTIAMVISIPSDEEKILSIGYTFLVTTLTVFFGLFLTKKKFFQPLPHSTSMPENEYATIDKWLTKITDDEFKSMLNSLREKIPSLIKLPDNVSKVDFLGAMQRWEKLKEVENYLLTAYPDRLNR